MQKMPVIVAIPVGNRVAIDPDTFKVVPGGIAESGVGAPPGWVQDANIPTNLRYVLTTMFCMTKREKLGELFTVRDKS